jgi:hypothetical protein
MATAVFDRRLAGQEFVQLVLSLVDELPAAAGSSGRPLRFKGSGIDEMTPGAPLSSQVAQRIMPRYDQDRLRPYVFL